MKRKLIFILSTFFLLCLCLTLSHAFVSAENDEISVLGATYKVKNNVISQDLGYGITHVKDIAQSSASRLNDYASCGPKDTIVGQQVNILTIESSKTTRIVNWTYMTNDGWTLQTVRNLAKNFELHNPGWKVVAAVNGDFFDINAKRALPYQGNGVHVSNGEVYRPSGSASNVGFKNDGSDYPLVGGTTCTTGDLVLAIYNENNEIIKEFKVDKTNSEVSGNELGVWFTYNVMEKNDLGTEVRTEIPITAPIENTYIITAPERCLPIGENEMYGKGNISRNTESLTLRFGQFAIQTTNAEITSYLQEGTLIRIQRNLTGAYAECDNVTGAGAQLIKNGEAVEEGGGLDRHPRTCVGIKEDGSIVLFTVDGRQFEQNMYGMSYAELSAALLNYGCVEAYNLDGGGSTTMIIRNEYGEFDVLNSPSDGNERNDSNALLVVVPDVTISIDKVYDTSAHFSYSISNEITVSNLKVQINDMVKEIGENEHEFTFDNLEKKTSYDLNYTFDIVYKDAVIKGLSGNLKFSTGKTVPKISQCYYEETDDSYILHFNIFDPEKTISQCFIKYDRTTASIYNLNETSLTLPKSRVTTPVFEFNLKYNIQSTPAKMITIKLPMTTFPQCQIIYELDGGINSDKNKPAYEAQDLPLQLHDATKNGYLFLGWFDQRVGGNKITEFSSFDVESVTIYAHFELINYSIKYELDGGKIDKQNKTQYNVEDGNINLYAPTKEGYKFLGWELDGKIIEKLDSSIAKDVTLKAKFEKITPPKQKGCSCKKNVDLIITLTCSLSLLVIAFRKRH